MSKYKFSACLRSIGNRGVPPTEFLDTLVDTIRSLPDSLFLPNEHRDFFGVLELKLGPWLSILQRRAATCEMFRVLGAEESDFNWNEGRDKSAGPETVWEQEAGIFQVSANSMYLDKSGGLRALVVGHCKLSDADAKTDKLAEAFIAAMKSDHAFAITYAFELLRVSTVWDGPFNRGVVTENVSRLGLFEFQTFLKAA